MKKERARLAAIALGLCVLAGFAARSYATGPFSFPHRPHLSATAIAGGADTDCRVCHDYSKGAREAHLTGCDKCHIDGEHLEKRMGAASARPEFQHKEHLFAKDGTPLRDVTCFTCHAMRADADWIEFSVPTSGLGPKSRGGKTGEKTCADCHAAHEPMGGLVTQDEKTGDGKACAQCHLKETSILPLKYRGDIRPAASKPFAHKDHGGATADCAQCHAGVKTSKTIWDYDPTKGTAEKCATCHVGDGGKPLVSPSATTTSLTRIDFSNFPHEKHLGEFSRMTCTTCHYPESDEQGRRVFPKRTASAEPVGRAQLVNYKVCDVCHGHDGWSPGKTSWHVEGHGVGAWACFKCHQGNVDEKGKLAIATTQRMHARGVGSMIVTHRHPGITTEGASLVDPTQSVGGSAKQCSDCHIGEIPELESRFVGQEFAHDSHVSTNPATAECLVCHADSGIARRSEDLDLISTIDECRRCHGRMTASMGGQGSHSPPDTVRQFDHAGHVHDASLVPGQKGIACTECHVPGGKSGYSIPADVLNCTKCHSHDEQKPDQLSRTGPKTSQGDATKCLFCHDQVRGEQAEKLGAPPRETIERKHLALGVGTQFHDKTGDCASCHVRDGAASVPYVERITKAQVRTSIHEDAKFADMWFNNPAIAKAGVDPQGRTCATCHRTEPRGYLRSLARR